MIKLLVIGNLGKDCVVNTVNGKNVINFNVAHTEKFKDNQGVQKEKTIWVECAWWTDRTGIAPYLRRGTQVFVEGTPDVRSYKKNDGGAGVSLTVRVMSVQLLGSKDSNSSAPDSGSAPATAKTNYTEASDITEPIDDLPF